MQKRHVTLGEKFGTLTVISDEFADDNYRRYVMCEHDCGHRKKCRVSKLVEGHYDICYSCNPRHLILDVGEKYENLEITSKPFKKDGYTWINVRCRCGTEKAILSSHWQRIKSCGCIIRKGYEEITGTYWRSAQNGAAERGWDFDLNIEDAWDLFIKQDRKCALSNWSLEMGNTASLDRIDPLKSYEINNVQWVHKDVNFSKWKLNDPDYRRLCWLINHLEQLNLPEIEIKIWALRKKDGVGNLGNTDFNHVIRNAKVRNLDFNLTPKYLWDLYVKQGSRCKFTGIPIYFEYYARKFKTNASLDRIDSSIGYLKGNVCWVYKPVNFMKQNYMVDYFKRICNAVAVNSSKPNLECLDEPSIVKSFDRPINMSKPQKRGGVYKGVDMASGKWRARVRLDGKEYHLGLFPTQEEAARAYDAKAIEIYGLGNCYLNFTGEV